MRTPADMDGGRVTTQPPTHPEFSGPHRKDIDPIQRLREIPDLAVEALLTASAPNPGASTGRTRRPKPGSKPPANLDIIDALRPDPDGIHATVHGEIAQAVRAVWEDHPHLDLPTPSLSGDCAWLITHRDLWQPDPFLSEFVTDSATRAHRHLQHLCRVEHEPRFVCPTCGWPMRLQDGDYFVCDGGEHQHPGPVALEMQWRRRPPSDTKTIIAMFATELGHTLTEPQIWQWHKRRKLTPARSEGRKLYWLPWDVMRCVQPEVVEALDAPGRTG